MDGCQTLLCVKLGQWITCRQNQVFFLPPSLPFLTSLSLPPSLSCPLSLHSPLHLLSIIPLHFLG